MSETTSADSALTVKTSDTPASRATSGRALPPPATLAALVLAAIAAVLAVIGWFRPSAGPGSFSAQETQDAKGHICAATATVRKANSINTRMANPVRGDQIGALAVAANARLALAEGSLYLQQRLAAEPAAPADLSKATAALADTMSELSINYLAGESAKSSIQQPLRDKLNTQLTELSDLCK